MDAKITKARLSNLWSYDWLKIIAIITLAIFAWIFLLNTIGTRPTYPQQIYLTYYKEIGRGNEASQLEEKLVDKNGVDGVFTHEVLETSTFFMSTGTAYADSALSARLLAGHYSLMFVSEQDAPVVDRGDEVLAKTPLDEFVGAYYTILEEVNDYLTNAENYLSLYFVGGIEGNTLDEDYIASSFRERAAGDKRYRSEKSILAGIEQEKQRLLTTRDSLITVRKALDKGIIRLSRNEYTYKGETATGNYSILLGTQKMTELSKLMFVSEGEGEDLVISSDGIHVCFFKMKGNAYEYMRYEKLNFIAYLVNNYSSEKV